ncbi:DUF2510 domain-containing protein [Nocardioides albidus]|uniref:DUF2510 domain-containing protein n=1 Tax=Nocardioides albidus TaxID=1517589 RepID=A0A5C4VQE7_9ACTN|nr:DUF2510 domain-containing protein [Nocardioides albidus]TNM37666.1 DUF2510 domain-containing protein [Nocardioides albidus]
MAWGKDYEEYDAKVRVPKGTKLDKSRKTTGAHRALARDSDGNLAGQAEILLQKKAKDPEPRSRRSPSPRSPSKVDAWTTTEPEPDISQLVPLALVAVAGIAAGAAGVALAKNRKRQRDAGRQAVAQPTTAPPGWYDVTGDPTRLRYWNGYGWTNDYAQRAGATAIAADWYPDPSNSAQLRYWDGAAWTHHVAPVPGTPTTPADWYPDPSNPAQLRYWDGRAWTGHVTSGPSTSVGVYTSAPDASRQLSRDEQIRMSNAEWQAHVRAWLQAGAIQQELWRRLSNAHIQDADQSTLAAQRRMEELSPEEGARRIHQMLEANPGLRDPSAFANFMAMFGGQPGAPLMVERFRE